MSTAASSLQTFVAMGGHGGYVWGSFGFAAAVVAFELIGLQARRRALNRRQAEAEPDDRSQRPPAARESTA